MRFDYSITEYPKNTAPIALKTIYKLEADMSYNVHKNLIDCKDIVALRTTGGEGVVILENFEAFKVKENTLLLFEHSKIRNYYCHDSSWNFWWFEFFSEDYLNFPLNKLLDITVVDHEFEECSHCLDLIRKNDPTSNQFASAYLNLLLNKWNYEWEVQNLKQNPYTNIVNRVISYMHTNLSTSLTIEEIAHEFGFSSRRLQQIFINITGASPKQTFTAIRLKKAEQLLVNTSMSITEISYHLGFSSPFHFSNTFYKSHGISPSARRKNF